MAPVVTATALQIARGLIVVCAALLVLAEGQRDDNNTPTSDGCYCFEPFGEGFALRNPLVFQSVPDSSGRVVVGEQTGVIYVYSGTGSQRNALPFLNLTDRVVATSAPADERGLLGVAFHPRFAINHRLFVTYTVGSRPGLVVRLSQFQTAGTDAAEVDRSTERILLETEQPFTNHNGGEIFFDYDGYLIMFTGDGGGAGDAAGNAQNKSSLLGKALRLDVDVTGEGLGAGGRPYGIPPNNPFVGEPDSRAEVFAYGLRNPWRCDIDGGDPQNNDEGRGRIFCGDVGQSEVEEIDLIESGGNYGWNIKEGVDCYKQEECGPIDSEKLPIYAYSHDVGKSVIGGHVYRGCRSPALNGRYVYGDLISGRIYYLEDTGGGTWRNAEMEWCGTSVCRDGMVRTKSRFILSFGKDADGEVYVLATDSPNPDQPGGHIYKIVDPLRPGDPTTCQAQTVAAGSGTDGHRPGSPALTLTLTLHAVLTLIIKSVAH